MAAGLVRFTEPGIAQLVTENAVAKGDVLAVARVAGIMAAKRTSEVVPLCHPLALSRAAVELEVVPANERDVSSEGAEETSERDQCFQCGAIRVEARVECQGPTGVEMEALSAVMGAALTIYDMCKAIDRGMIVEDIRVGLKEGGKSGKWVEEGYVPLIF